MRQWLLVAAAFFISAAVTALIFSTPVVSSRDGRVSSYSESGAPLTALPSAFKTDRLIPLTDASSVTRWAPVLRTSVAHRTPSFSSARVGLVSARTPENTTNLVIAEREVVRHGVVWVRVPLAVLPNGTEGWLPRSSLGSWSFIETHLVVNRAHLTATLFSDGRAIFSAPVAVGAPGTPTPAGTFYIRDRLKGFDDPFYGPLAFGTNARSPTLTEWPAGGFVGIHGTDQSNLIPGRVSHGCIRMTNAAITRLGELMPIGTPVTIT